jgi:hypothetical protein
MIILGVGEWVTEHKIDFWWLLKVRLVGAVIAFSIYAMFVNPR